MKTRQAVLRYSDRHIVSSRCPLKYADLDSCTRVRVVRNRHAVASDKAWLGCLDAI